MLFHILNRCIPLLFLYLFYHFRCISSLFRKDLKFIEINKMKRGALIVLEGCDRVGKSTQARKLVEELNKHNIRSEQFRFPDRSTVIGQLINSYLINKTEMSDRVIHLLFSANRWELEPKINELLLNGTTVVIDRYSYSGVAYSAAKHNMDEKWCWQVEFGLPKPDLVFFLSSKSANSRNNYGNERYENKNFQEKVYCNYQNMRDSTWKDIITDNSIDVVNKEMLNYVKEVISNVCNKPLRHFP